MAEKHQAKVDSGEDPREEQSRRTFLANATLAVGGVIGLVLTVPLVTSLIPQSLISPEKSAGGVWAGLPPEQFKQLVSKPGTPLRISFDFKYADGYFPPADRTQFLWGVKLTPEQAANFRTKRPDLYKTPAGTIGYDAIVMSFVLFSSICPHLGCRVEWNYPGYPDRFFCPCHGSQYGVEGDKLAGPAPRGLDPLPMREVNGRAEVTWIQYKSGASDRVIVAYS